MIERLPPELIHLIFVWVEPAQTLVLRRLSTRLQVVLSDRCFARQAVRRLAPACASPESTRPAALDALWLRAPDFMAAAALGARLHLRAIAWRGAVNSGALPLPLPPTIARLALLTRLSLANCGFAGPLPEALGELARLESLELSGTELNGSIPLSLGNLSSLTRLSIHETTISGPIPPSLGNLRRLQTLHLYKNCLTGEIPPEIGNLKRLTSLKLDCNQLTGPLPFELGGLSALMCLFVDNNNMKPPRIPLSFGRLESLEHFTVDEACEIDRRLGCGRKPCGPPNDAVVPSRVNIRPESLEQMEERLWECKM
ncbi:hypothetical protein BDR26DRAFT_1007190 [Obelidium mucronatum]|nr:hypothetical protein BDR26DRAFT_1007190 [Obelidium mucronatum]